MQARNVPRQGRLACIVLFEKYMMSVQSLVDLPASGPATEPFFKNPADWFVPSFVEKLDQLGVNPGFVAELALKAVSLDPDATTARVADQLHLGLMVTDALLQRLNRDKFVEAKGTVGMHNHRYGMLDRGWVEVHRIMQVCSYSGAAPVSLDAYAEKIIQQSRSRAPVAPESIDRAMAELVLEEDVRRTLGMVASSGRSLFLNGPSGNGKTAMARALVNSMAGDLWIPYAIEVGGQIIRVYDTHLHHTVPHVNEDYDHRWVRIRPPLVMAGGELTIQSLDLICTDSQRFYEAPLQVKSNGGVLVVDDLGRQRCSARELLNRWIVPLENRIDYLTLSTGKKIQMPFEQVVVFATNLTESDLMDEAFLRRMGYRLNVRAPSPNKYGEIFTRYARTRGLSLEPNVVTHVLERYFSEARSPKCCDPRDLIERVVDLCKFESRAMTLTEETVDIAWNSYFGVDSNGARD